LKLSYKKSTNIYKILPQFLWWEIASEWGNSLVIKFLETFIIPRLEINMFDDQRHLICYFTFFCQFRIVFIIKIYDSMCLWSSTITHGFWLDKVSKYHIDSLAKMIVQMATSAQLEPFKDGIFDTFSVSSGLSGPSWEEMLSCGLSVHSQCGKRTGNGDSI